MSINRKCTVSTSCGASYVRLGVTILLLVSSNLLLSGCATHKQCSQAHPTLQDDFQQSNKEGFVSAWSPSRIDRISPDELACLLHPEQGRYVVSRFRQSREIHLLYLALADEIKARFGDAHYAEFIENYYKLFNFGSQLEHPFLAIGREVESHAPDNLGSRVRFDSRSDGRGEYFTVLLDDEGLLANGWSRYGPSIKEHEGLWYLYFPKPPGDIRLFSILEYSADSKQRQELRDLRRIIRNIQEGGADNLDDLFYWDHDRIRAGASG